MISLIRNNKNPKIAQINLHKNSTTATCRGIKWKNWNPVASFSPGCGRIYIKTRGIESKFIIYPETFRFASLCVELSTQKCTDWGNEGVISCLAWSEVFSVSCFRGVGSTCGGKKLLRRTCGGLLQRPLGSRVSKVHGSQRSVRRLQTPWLQRRHLGRWRSVWIWRRAPVATQLDLYPQSVSLCRQLQRSCGLPQRSFCGYMR